MLRVPGDFPDDSDTPDHRPVEATLLLKDAAGDPTTQQLLLERIAEIEGQLEAMKVMIGQLPN